MEESNKGIYITYGGMVIICAVVFLLLSKQKSL